MRAHSAVALLISILAVLYCAGRPSESWAQPCAPAADYETAARNQYECSSLLELRDLPAGESEFRIHLQFPQQQPPADNLPWRKINFREEPEQYIRTLLQYGIRDNAPQDIDWRIEKNTKSVWCHAPWFHGQRERLRGMTSERGSRIQELHILQTSRAQNWAVGFYNDIGCFALGRVWSDPARPKTKDFAFPVGAYSIKLLFTTATPKEVPYLTGSKIWKAAIGRDGAIVEMRLLQVDVAVRDDRADGQTGWIFGTFIYDAYAPGVQVWEKLVPVGLMWGNDPNLITRDYEENGVKPKEGWLNLDVAEKFYHLPRHNLGLHGRVNGPVDNPKSACLACHGRALDWGRAIIRESRAEDESAMLLPFAPNPTRDDDVRRYFRNLKPNEPFVEGTQALDYSLQLAVGLEHFRRWVLCTFPSSASASRDVPPRKLYEGDQSDDPSSQGCPTASTLLSTSTMVPNPVIWGPTQFDR